MCELRVKVEGVTARGQFAFALNGKPVAPDCVQRLHAPRGRDTRVHSVPLEPYSQYVLLLSGGELHHGINVLTVALTERDPDLFGTVGLVELELALRY